MKDVGVLLTRLCGDVDEVAPPCRSRWNTRAAHGAEAARGAGATVVAGALQMALSMSPRPLGQIPAKRGFRVAKRDAGKGGSPAGVARRRRVAAAKGRKAMPFMRGQLARNKKEHATHCRRLPGGRPLIHIIEPKWWKDSKQRRQTCGGRGKPGMCDDPAKALPRIHTQISIVRREQLMLDTYATDRMCSESIHLLPTAELGRAAGTIRSAKLKIKDNLRLLIFG